MTWDNGLDDIKWGELSHAYGEADDVPALLRNLTSDSEDVRTDAICDLYGNIWHQGTIYEATAPAIPFLIELHAIEGLPAHNDIATLLMLIGAGRGYYEVHSKIGVSPPDESSLEDTLAEERRNRGAVRKALSPILSQLPAYRHHADRNLREVTLRLIAANTDFFPDARSMLEAALTSETDEDIVEQLQDQLSELLA